ncbi:MAG: Xaa-Pro peptidase family protein [Methanocellales archaeon]|nr:Xaa-Pro peptidase family protein [Methanocellales archaeon]MDD3292309.1 Xaa-Pro peptidase family protein [Methanocellales archaeon]MDD5235581.1 Xaa-Pro peptidase family protein [Methanocellales archaeon]MDD5485773.1 Xaa-Pro peptidase family protein [Methanocellales archaeon]
MEGLAKRLKEMDADALMLVSDSIRDANMFYLTNFLAPDPFFYLGKGESEFIIVSKMEFSRAKKESRVKDVRSTAEYGLPDLLKKYKDAQKARSEMLKDVLNEEGVKRIVVPSNFPFFIARELRDFEMVPTRLVEESREVKNKAEIESIKKAQRACESAMDVAIELVRKAEIDKEFLRLTAEEVKVSIEHELIKQGCGADDIIVASGKQASDPHCSGSGRIEINTPIIIDIFPYLKKERYNADMTRTVLRGTPTKEIEEMYRAVCDAQNIAIGKIRAGVTGKEVHEAACDLFRERGYEFVHSTGHGVGLDIHEGPSLAENGNELKVGNVITVEPGLYDPNIGGVRLEDLVLVTAKGCKNLTRFPKQLVI